MIDSTPRFTNDSSSDVDSETHVTDWASGFARLEQETGHCNSSAAPPVMAPPGKANTQAEESCEAANATDHNSLKFLSEDELDDYDPDTATGASPGVSSACRDLGLSSLDTVTRKLNIKPPGQI